jgi:hypothetical protein
VKLAFHLLKRGLSLLKIVAFVMSQICQHAVIRNSMKKGHPKLLLASAITSCRSESPFPF